MTNMTPTADQLATMKQIAGFFGGQREARSLGYISLDGYTCMPDGVPVDVDAQVIVRRRGNQWRKGVVIGHGRTRIVVATFNETALADDAVRVQAYRRDAVMLKTEQCRHCDCYIHPAYDDLDQVDTSGRRFCSDTCLYIYNSAQRELAAARA